MAEVRDEKDAVEATPWRERGARKHLENCRHVEWGPISTTLAHFHVASEGKQCAINRKHTPDPLITLS